MKITRVIKLARVSHDNLQEGDGYRPLVPGTDILCPHDIVYNYTGGGLSRGLVAALDTKKYPPKSVTYTAEGIPESAMEIVEGQLRMSVMFIIPASEIKTVYK